MSSSPTHWPNIQEPLVLPYRPPRRRRWPWLLLVLSALLLTFCWLLYQEARHSTRQALLLSQYANQLTYQVEPGSTSQVFYPREGPAC